MNHFNKMSDTLVSKKNIFIKKLTTDFKEKIMSVLNNQKNMGIT